MPSESPGIANEILRLARDSGRPLTQMQIQKLVYIAHGWNLAVNGEALTVDQPRAFPYGPVYRALSEALSRYGTRAVDRLIRVRDFGGGVFYDADDPDGDREARAFLSDPERAVVRRVFNDYGAFHAFQLSALTHERHTPWSEVYNNGRGQYNEIGNRLIRDHFVELGRKRREQRLESIT